MSESIHLDIEHGVLRITIDRQARMNAIDLATMAELGEAITAAANEPTTRVIVLTGAGTAFCTGADLAAAAAAGGNEASPEVVMDRANDVIRAIVDSPLPVIAEVNGPAAGVGTSIALAADLIYAAEGAYLLLPFTSIGLMPDGGATAVVAAAMGRARAAELALLGGRLPAAEAAAAGLITRSVPAEELREQVDTVAAKLAVGPRRALELTKAAINAATLPELDGALAREKTGQIELLTSADFLEGMTAMLTRRAPKFAGAPSPVADPA
ncbi:enoyl-CoA hydratase-related protein [Nocardia asteroides]|uniref:Enoyl-CoA hydratase n=1 Tax=Nocardia asteroides NBRC 15531 TaxID=1110697 RepID=U5E972_NOCAS|nr:enoyl-CoA hydratase-related protein [Nocardia asteroides]TLF66888.1 enoyl-CoA hydratase [Nocardia asteroides NBRC 15531]UGT51864.1 enoyl-CoA hydratase-related protein [Nocardia asteroides]SFM15013.1 Enoyl-CoA hydratase/carnithine racemase [Nocardia asteroides]VEG35224.1 Carnitinyl-CoA dehydratase [Nocardia asteroides]GAD86622.1 putative enoyl-CoA hydratase [Nocardia asteroides NBRC 15531]